MKLCVDSESFASQTQYISTKGLIGALSIGIKSATQQLLLKQSTHRQFLRHRVMKTTDKTAAETCFVLQPSLYIRTKYAYLMNDDFVLAAASCSPHM